MKTKILDCTLRDGGYYTNWDFDKNLVETYCRSMEDLPVEYVEVGYRSIPKKEYLGEFFYCPEYVMKGLKQMMPSKKLVIILNEKDIDENVIEELLTPCLPFISMVRVAVDPSNFYRAISTAKKIKSMGFELAFNVMYMSSWKEDATFLDLLKEIDDVVDYFYMVDSYGGILPKDLDGIMNLVSSKTKIPLGFHGHNNLEMALTNTLRSIENGCEIVDATITGMGRGAGNLRTELLLTYLNSVGELDVSFTSLSRTVDMFEKLKSGYGWGASLPYMFSGAFSLPQKQVMEWVTLNRYPLSSILNALNNSKSKVQDNQHLPLLEKTESFENAIIIGGGESVKLNYDAIRKFVDNMENCCVIHAGVKYVSDFFDLPAPQYYALVGFEGEKMESSLGSLKRVKSPCIFPPYPRTMGTIIPTDIADKSFELSKIEFTSKSVDSPLSIGVQAALDLGCKDIYMLGFDGYDTTRDKNQVKLAEENHNIIDDLLSLDGVSVVSLTPSNYNNITCRSIYSFL